MILFVCRISPCGDGVVFCKVTLCQRANGKKIPHRTLKPFGQVPLLAIAAVCAVNSSKKILLYQTGLNPAAVFWS